MKFWEFSQNEQARLHSSGSHGLYRRRRRTIQGCRGEFAKGDPRNGGNQKSQGGSGSQVQASTGSDGQADEGTSGYSNTTAKRQTQPDWRAGIDAPGTEKAAGIAALARRPSGRRRS